MYEENFNQVNAKGVGRGGRGKDQFYGRSNYDNAWFTKVSNINEIQKFARIPQTIRV